MRLSKLNLISVVAVAHSDDYLQLLVDKGDELEITEISAPIQAFEGLQQLNKIVTEPVALPESEIIAMLPVNSYCANAVGYDSKNETLQVKFANGAIYQYWDVDLDTWEQLYLSDSFGNFYNQNIRGRYQLERLNDNCDC